MGFRQKSGSGCSALLTILSDFFPSICLLCCRLQSYISLSQELNIMGVRKQRDAIIFLFNIIQLNKMSGHYNRDYYGRDRSREKIHHHRRDHGGYEHDDYDRNRRRRRSRSNSRERPHHGHHSHSQHSDSRDRAYRNSPESYAEREIEEKEQKLRLAIRNNTVQFDAKLLQMLRNLPSNKQDQLTQEAQSNQKIHQCILVRELFISGLSEMNEVFIDSIMKQYGEIQKIQIIKNFAYVKFHKVEDASNACAEYHTINMRIHSVHNSNFKIFFADHVKRWNVVSNSINYENKEDLVPVIYASIRNENPFNNEQFIRENLSKFGFIRNIEMKASEMSGPKVYKSYVLVQFETLTQALRARERIRQNRERYLGDRKAEVTLLLDSQKITRQWQNVKNQLRYQIKRQTNNAKMMNPMGSNPTTINPFIQHNSQSQLDQMMGGKPMGGHLHQPVQHQHHPDNNSNNNQIFDFIRQYAQKQPDHMEGESDWVGFFTRNKQFRIEVDFTLIHKVQFELQMLLNITHRATFADLETREDYVVAGKFKAANNLNAAAFQKYVDYFIKKNKAGIIQSRKYLIYLYPPLESLALPYPTRPDELLGLFYKL